jgi:hypothetical protein
MESKLNNKINDLVSGDFKLIHPSSTKDLFKDNSFFQPFDNKYSIIEILKNPNLDSGNLFFYFGNESNGSKISIGHGAGAGHENFLTMACGLKDKEIYEKIEKNKGNFFAGKIFRTRDSKTIIISNRTGTYREKNASSEEIQNFLSEFREFFGVKKVCFFDEKSQNIFEYTERKNTKKNTDPEKHYVTYTSPPSNTNLFSVNCFNCSGQENVCRIQ